VERIGVVKEVGGAARVIDSFGDRRALRAMPEAPVGSWVLARDGEVVQLLAEPGSGLADLYAIAARAGISPLHDEACLAEASALVGAPGIDDPALVDLSALPLVTIDEVSSKDLDQAVCIEASGDGFVVWYALADASWFIRPGMALYEAALARGSSYYLPGLVLPMLPAVLSEDLISLNPAVDRRAMVFELHLDSAGRLSEKRLHRARVRCRHKLAFDWVQSFLDGEPVDWDADVQASLRLLREVGERRIRLAEERNVIRYRRAEVDVHLDGRSFIALDGPRNDVERYNEQISLLTNIEGARFLLAGDTDDDHIQPIYRVHEAPGEERFAELRASITEITRLHGLDAKIWVWEPDSEGLNAYLERLPDTAVARAIHRQAMIANRPSHYASTPGLHYGVGADVYGRFTAPMREVVGIFLHNEAWEKLRGAPFDVPAGYEGDALRERVIASSNKARMLQRKFDREANRLVLDDLFAEAKSSGRLEEGTVLGVTSTRVHVQLDSPRIDVKVYVPHIEKQWSVELSASKAKTALLDSAGEVRLRIGDRVRLGVTGRDHKRDRWELDLKRLGTEA